MVVYNYTGKEINAKVVYYGPALSGKTTNLEWIYSKIPVEYSGKMVSLRTQADRTIFFDFLPLDLGVVDGFRTRFMLYTVPGQVHYNATRKMVLKGVDGVVFVADSEPSRMQDNLESLKNLRENIEELGIDPDSIPLVLQWNKRDLPNGMDVTELERQMNPDKLASFEACALTGEGVYETLHALCQLIYRKLSGGAELGATAADDGASLFGDTIAQCLQEIDERPSAPVPLALEAQEASEKTEADDASVLAAILGGRETHDAAVAVATETATASENENENEKLPEATMGFEFDAPDTPDMPGRSTRAPGGGASGEDVQVPAGPANSLGQALDDVLGQDSSGAAPVASDAARPGSEPSAPQPEETTFEQPVDVIAELQSLSAESDDVSAPTTDAPEADIDLDMILSEDSEGTENNKDEDSDDGLGLIKDPRRLPTEASRELPPLSLGSGAVSVATAPSKTRVLEVPVTLDSNVFENGQSLRIVLNITVKR